MAKQPALSLQLKDAQARIVELEQKLAKEIGEKETWYMQWQRKDDEINQLQAMLDAFPDCPPRRAESAYFDLGPAARIAGWLATKLR